MRIERPVPFLLFEKFDVRTVGTRMLDASRAALDFCATIARRNHRIGLKRLTKIVQKAGLWEKCAEAWESAEPSPMMLSLLVEIADLVKRPLILANVRIHGDGRVEIRGSRPRTWQKPTLARLREMDARRRLGGKIVKRYELAVEIVLPYLESKG